MAALAEGLSSRRRGLDPPVISTPYSPPNPLRRNRRPLLTLPGRLPPRSSCRRGSHSRPTTALFAGHSGAQVSTKPRTFRRQQTSAARVTRIWIWRQTVDAEDTVSLRNARVEIVR